MAQHRQVSAAGPFSPEPLSVPGRQSRQDRRRRPYGSDFDDYRTDVDAVVRNNIRLSIDLWSWCSQANIPLIYASSAATYGDGREGFLDRFDTDT